MVAISLVKERGTVVHINENIGTDLRGRYFLEPPHIQNYPNKTRYKFYFLINQIVTYVKSQIFILLKVFSWFFSFLFLILSLSMKPKQFGTPIFIFEDYVDYLKAWYSYARRFGLTQKVFMEKAHIDARAFFSDVLTGRKKIGEKHIQGFVNALELSPDEAEYFLLLVHKKNSRDPGQINAIGAKLASIRAKKTSAILSGGGTLEYFSSWKYPVIREYIRAKGFVRSPKEISSSLLHLKLGLAETRHALNKLEKWDMIEFDQKRGGYCPKNDSLVTYSEMPHAVVNDVKRSFIESSIHSMENLEKGARNISIAIRGMNRETYERFCMKIDAVRKEFLESDEGIGKSDHVYTLLVQLFPVMKVDHDFKDEMRPQ